MPSMNEPIPDQQDYISHLRLLRNRNIDHDKISSNGADLWTLDLSKLEFSRCVFRIENESV